MAKSAVTNTDPGVYTVMDSFGATRQCRTGHAPLRGGRRLHRLPPPISATFRPASFSGDLLEWPRAGGKPLKLSQTSPHGLGSGLSHTGLLMGPTISNGTT